MTKRPLKSHFLAALAAGLMCLAAALPMSAQSGCNITMPDVQGSGGGTVTVPVSLTNPIGIFSMQIEVFLPDGVDIVGMERAARIEGATNFNYAQQDQYTAVDSLRYRRVLINNLMPSDGSAIEAGEGEIFTITFQLPEGEGTYPIQLKNIQFFNPPTFAIEYIPDVTANLTAANFFFTIPDVQATWGETVDVPLYLNNAGGIYSIQIDLMLADGVEFVDVTLGDRVNAEFFQYGSEDKYTEDSLRYRRVIIANIQNMTSAINGNEGLLLTYKLKAQYHSEATCPVRVMNIQYFNPPTFAIEYIADAEGTINVSPKPVTPGDVNHDGVVDIDDVTLLIATVLGQSTCCPICGDIDNSQKIDIDDITEAIDIVLGV